MQNVEVIKKCELVTCSVDQCFCTFDQGTVVQTIVLVLAVVRYY